MKKIMLTILLWGIMVLGITGCGNNESTKDKDKNNSSNENTNSNNIVLEKTYYCTEKYDDDWYVYLYYKNDELAKIRILAASWSGLFEDYSEIKAESMEYEGVSLSKDSDFIYFDIDVRNGGYKYLNYAFGDDLGDIEKNSSWENVNKIMNRKFECVEK